MTKEKLNSDMVSTAIKWQQVFATNDKEEFNEVNLDTQSYNGCDVVYFITEQDGWYLCTNDITTYNQILSWEIKEWNFNFSISLYKYIIPVREPLIKVSWDYYTIKEIKKECKPMKIIETKTKWYDYIKIDWIVYLISDIEDYDGLCSDDIINIEWQLYDSNDICDNCNDVY